MVREVCIESVTLARALSKFGKRPQSVTSLSPQFRIPQTLWSRIERYTSGSRSWTPASILFTVFNAASGSQQKALVGSLIVEHGLRLKKKQEMEFITALLDCGFAPLAIKLWKERQVGYEVKPEAYTKFLITIYCRSLRVNDAEKLSAQTRLTPTVALELILAYSRLKNTTKTEKWTMKLLELNWKSPTLIFALRQLVNNRMWASAQRIITKLTECDISVPSDITAACIHAVRYDANDASVAKILSRDGSIVNSSRFRQVVGNNPQRLVTDFLREGKFDEAVKVLLDYRGSHELTICHRLLNWLQPLAKKDPSKFVEQMRPVVQHAQESKGPSGWYVQFMLSYYYSIRAYKDLWNLVADYDLASNAPKVSPASAVNYDTLWLAVLATIRSRQPQCIPFSLRDLLTVTLSKSAISPQLLPRMALSFAAVADIQGLITLLEYAAANCDIELDPKVAQKLLPGEDDAWDKGWQTIAQRLCKTYSRDFEEVKLSSMPLRSALNMS